MCVMTQSAHRRLRRLWRCVDDFPTLLVSFLEGSLIVQRLSPWQFVCYTTYTYLHGITVSVTVSLEECDSQSDCQASHLYVGQSVSMLIVNRASHIARG